MLTLFDKDHFDESKHPILAYNSKAACLKHFRENAASYKKIYPLAHEILSLYEEVQKRLPDLYNTARGQGGKVSGGRFGLLTGVTKHEKKKITLPYTRQETKFSVPTGFSYPILAAFRAMLVEQNGHYVWAKGAKPSEVLNGPLGQELANAVGEVALDHQNPSKTGKSSNLWKTCYQTVEIFQLRNRQ